jgi:hypothetical protein
MERRGSLLGGITMPGAPIGEVHFDIECRESREFRLDALVSGSADMAAAIDVEVSRAGELLYRGPLLALSVTERLAPGTSEIIVRGWLASDYRAEGTFSLRLRAYVAGI